MNVSPSKDFELIARLNKTVHDLHVQLHPEIFQPFDEKAMADFFRRVVENEQHVFWIAESESAAIGYAWIEFKDYPETMFKKAYRSLYVHQLSFLNEVQNKGYGQQIMQEISKLALSKEINLIELDYWVRNEKAKRFYEKMGFVKQREFVYKKL